MHKYKIEEESFWMCDHTAEIYVHGQNVDSTRTIEWKAKIFSAIFFNSYNRIVKVERSINSW